MIGLAVVVALAMAAVFGAMSLTNPAFAAVGAPADAELTERTFSPQAATLMFHDGQEFEYDITSLVTGGGSNYKGLVTAETIVDPVGLVVDGVSGVEVDDGFGAITLQFTGATLAEDVDPLTGRIYITLDLNEGDDQRLRFDVTLLQETDPSVVDTVDDMMVQAGLADNPDTAEEDDALPGKKIDLDVSDNFADGAGTGGAVFNYTVTVAQLGAGDPNVEVGEDGADVTDAGDWSTTQTTTDGKFELRAAAGAEDGDTSRVTVEVRGSDNGTTANSAADATTTFFVDVVARRAARDGVGSEGLPSLEADSMDPGKNTRYTLEFDLDGSTNTLIHDLVIELPDYGVPGSISTSAVTITTGNYTFTPEDVSVDGEEIFISIGDVTEDVGGTTNNEGGVYEIGPDSDGEEQTMKVVFRQSAGISNPTESGTYFANINFGGNSWEYNEDEKTPKTLTDVVPHKISLDEEDGGLGTLVAATGKGFKDKTTLTVFLDKKVLVMWNPRGDSSDRMVPLPGGMVAEYNELVMNEDDAERGNVPGGTIPTKDGDDGTALHTDNDGYALAPNRNLDLTDEELCAVDKIGSNDVGKCEFTVTHPTFDGGLNYINAVDGRNNYDLTPVTFELTSSIQASPDGGSPGEIILIQVVDFTAGSSLEKVTLGRQDYCGGDNNPVETSFTCPALTVDSTGSGNFKITVPNWARSGVQELKVFGTGDDDGSQNVTIGGPVINVTPGTVWANQRISLVGTGFSSNAIIGDDDLLEGTDAENDLSKISIGGEVIRRSRISDGEDVEVDSGGNWSASVDLPLSSSTTSDGERVIRVTDSGGRSGVVTVSILPREVTVTPDTGRVGTLAVVRGKGFPSKNDEGSSFNVEIVYDAGNDKEITVSAVPDASGRFEVQLRIPTTAAIPSSNTVKVSFEDDDDVVVVTTVAHDVPEGIITLSNTSGGPGSTVTINGEGFKAFVPVALVKVGTLDVTPAPKPSTDGNGMMSFDVTIPGLDVGIQTIEVNVGRTTSSTGFTVTASGISAGDITASAEAVEEMGDNFVRAFNFNNDTKTWTFYDPAAGDASTLAQFITGESYWILIKATQEVILNRETRNLTCVDGNCWNQIVW